MAPDIFRVLVQSELSNIFIYVVTARLSIFFMSNVNKITLTFQNSCSRSFEIFCSNSSKLQYFVINKNYSSLVINFYQNVWNYQWLGHCFHNIDIWPVTLTLTVDWKEISKEVVLDLFYYNKPFICKYHDKKGRPLDLLCDF